jgi:hypothetical protein
MAAAIGSSSDHLQNMTTSAEGEMMSSSPLESGFNTRDWPVKTGYSEVIQFDV